METAETVATGFRILPDWTPHARTLMAWPRAATWGSGWRDAERAYAGVANAISEYEPVTMLIPEQRRQVCRKLLGGAIDCLEWPYDDAWLRDSGPSIVTDRRGERHAVSWNFNGWGDRFRPWAEDRRLAARIAAWLEVPLMRAGLVLEGGALQVDGAGRLLVTRQSLLDERRNPGAREQDLLRELQRLTGCDRIIVLPSGLPQDHTFGHVDELAVFSAPGRVMLHAPEAGDPAAAACREAREVLSRAGLDIVQVPAPAGCGSGEREQLALSYINCYPVNGAVIVPAFEQPRSDREAAAVIAGEYPRRRVVTCQAAAIAIGGGAIHCITWQQPQYDIG